MYISNYYHKNKYQGNSAILSGPDSKIYGFPFPMFSKIDLIKNYVLRDSTGVFCVIYVRTSIWPGPQFPATGTSKRRGLIFR
ncbi:hypothetical protein SPIRO4BDMA_50627 [uncultured spirochete]|jgi:hypothetical protein|uniref:Uncharacterized protein n=1 Tax=uncultured spirochete TaxID=156406 RepID=A0A3P3XS28_9SPIR|nr:hypothetical protein SPIRO4BDMA_50627 [uncultured spirochete]